MKLIDLKPLEQQLVEAGIEPAHSETCDLPPIYRENRTDRIYCPDVTGNFICTGEGNLELALMNCGVELPDKGRNAVIADYKRSITHTSTVCFAGEIAACKAGLVHTSEGDRVLVTRSARTVEPRNGDWSTIKAFFDAVFGGVDIQVLTFLSFVRLWLLDFRRSLEVGPWLADLRQSQAMIIIGPPNCGKTLLLEVLRPLFGGRVVDPFPFFTGETAFNAEHAAAGILCMDDSAESVNPGARQRLTQRLKSRLVVADYRIHPKGQTPFTIRCCQRIFIMANEDSLDVLPLITDSFKDKVHVLRAFRSNLISQDLTHDTAPEWKKQLEGELPAFAHYLLHEFDVPTVLQNGRFGLRPFHDPELLAALEGSEEPLAFISMVEFAIALLSEASNCSLVEVAFPDDVGMESLKDLNKWSARNGKSPKLSSQFDDGPLRFTFRATAREIHALMTRMLQPELVRTTVRLPVHVGKTLEHASYCYPEKVERAKHIHGTRRWKIEFQMNVEVFNERRALYGNASKEEDRS